MRKIDLAGVDVSAKTFTVRRERSGRCLDRQTFSNDAAGHARFIRCLRKKGRGARVCLEASGIYSLDLALALHRAPDIEVMVVNPLAAHDFAGAFLQRSKTDGLDADVLLEFARRMPFRAWEPPEPEVLDLRSISRRIEALIQNRAQEKNRLHAARHNAELTAVVRHDIELHIGQLSERIAELRGQAQQLIGRHPVLSQIFIHLTSIPGIAEASAVAILGELLVLPRDMTVRQWVAHAGLDPRREESGTSVRKQPRISRKGNPRLRHALFLPALVAVRHDPHVRAFYDQLVARGKTKMQANVAVMRKLLHAIYGMLKHGADFDGRKFYSART